MSFVQNPNKKAHFSYDMTNFPLSFSTCIIWYQKSRVTINPNSSLAILLMPKRQKPPVISGMKKRKEMEMNEFHGINFNNI